MFGLLALALALTLVIVACGGDDATEAPANRGGAQSRPRPLLRWRPRRAPAATMGAHGRACSYDGAHGRACSYDGAHGRAHNGARSYQGSGARFHQALGFPPSG